MRKKEYRKANIYKDKLVYFFSSSSPRNAKLLFEMGIQQQLISYHYILKAEKVYETEVLPLFDFDGQGLFMTDSGGATYVEAFRNKTYEESWFHADHWKPYLQAYTEWLYEHRKMIFVAANIDLEMYVGNSIVDKWNRKYFKPLEKDINIAYVVHESQFDKQGIKRFTQYCQEHSYVGVNSDLILQHAKFYSIARQYRRRVHGFAVSSIPTLTASPMFSCDSSVVGDSFVTVRSNGLIEHLRIDELFNRLTSYRTTPTELRAPLRNYETLTLDDSNKVVWSKLRSVVQHVVSKPMIKLELEGGETLEVTADHSMILVDHNGDTYEASAEVLKKGDFVLSPKKFVPNDFDTPTVTFEIPHKAKKWGKHEGEHTVMLNNAMLEFLGMWLGDGGYNGEQGVQLSCYDDPETLRVITIIAYRFGATITECKNGVDCHISNKVLREFMNHIGMKGHSHTKRIPKQILSLCDEQLFCFLRGYFSTDGCGNGLAFSTTSKGLMKDLTLLLNGFGIYCSVSSRKAGTKVLKGKSVNIKPLYVVSIKDVSSRKKFLDNIGFLQPYQNDILAKQISDTGVRMDNHPRRIGIPVKLSSTGFVKYKRDKVKITKPYVKDYRISVIGNEDNFSEKLRSSEVNFLKVKSVTHYMAEDLDVYDLEVPNTEKFIANGVIVHNTTWLGGARYGTTYRFNGANLRTIDYHNKHVRKRDKILCEDYNIDFEKFLGDAETEINKHAIVNWDAAMGKIRKIGDTKMWNEPVVNYDFNRKSKLIVPKIIV